VGEGIVARDSKRFIRPAHMGVQPTLRYVDADEDLFHDPSLQMRSRMVS
jgi:hypothetical protein